MNLARSRTFSALQNPNYRIYLAGSFGSNIGTWMQRVAQDWLVLELTGSALAVGITTALQFLPTLLLSPYTGLIADRFDKRKVLWFSQGWMALMAAVLGAAAITGVATAETVYLLALLFGVGSAIDVPARQSFVSELVGRENLTNAIGLNSATFHLARIIGPALAGVVIAGFGSGWAIATNAVTYLAFLLAITLLDASKLQTVARVERAKGQIREGIAYVRDRADLLLVLLIAFSVGTWGMNFQMTIALMASQEFDKGAEQYGILGSFMAVGSLAGALMAARRTSAPRVRQVVMSAIAFAVAEMALGLMPSYLFFAIGLPVVGLISLLTLTAANAAVQMGTTSGMRGRVMALYSMVLMGGTPIGAPLLGLLAEHFGPRSTLIGGGALTLIGIGISVALVIRFKHLDVETHLRPRPSLAVREPSTPRV
ncbi:MFS transporter [Naumannella halotolerans]|uniref:Putative MFS family arabinose efflux permease n=1 Tax=Naumannella halotolerans TaxID=993414 RepID=A0A4R7J7M1_9ACTN|nr:MFS transporter [Naumannella halotolerans]TDT32453.1 putative MFS family arabinose efflux permease [Naumannella halotolerans]